MNHNCLKISYMETDVQTLHPRMSNSWPFLSQGTECIPALCLYGRTSVTKKLAGGCWNRNSHSFSLILYRFSTFLVEAWLEAGLAHTFLVNSRMAFSIGRATGLEYSTFIIESTTLGSGDVYSVSSALTILTSCSEYNLRSSVGETSSESLTASSGKGMKVYSESFSDSWSGWDSGSV